MQFFSNNTSNTFMLFINNVYFRDLDETPKPKLSPERKVVPVIKKMSSPKTCFTCLEHWKVVPGIMCWSCDCEIKGKPVFVPNFVEPKRNSVRLIKCEGFFCSFSCASRYIATYYSSSYKLHEKKQLLRFLFNIFYQQDPRSIPPAPFKFQMIKYGGTKTEIQFQKQIATMEKNLVTSSKKKRCA